MEPESKKSKYDRAMGQLEEIIGKTDDVVSRMATIVAVLYYKMTTFYWVGFYRLVDSQLLVGPYQGTVACLLLPEDKGVCRAVVNRKQTIIVPDVHEFAGHIACDPHSKSEIVVPCFDKEGNVFAVLDVDSDQYNAFDEIDGQCLEQIVRLINK